MTNFLPAGIIKESILEICNKVTEIKESLDKDDIERSKRLFSELEDKTFELGVFIEKLSCEPLIYTGRGNTEEVIKRLDWALTFTEEIDPGQYFKYKFKGKKRRLK
ncbi:MAG: hypothetical protein ABFD08_18070 [Syntrophomonas sp.]